ncbi:MAG TPA: molybdopterin molybdotransferase MoeA [Terracidiphilus sp.]|nr:molybdopterin molybdotransferase MoeA [Terracidiphilus sp.]
MSAALLTYEEAAALIADHASHLLKLSGATEHVDLASAAGRILARPLRADTDQPPFPRSTRDGFACRAHEASTHQPLPIAGSTRAGQPPPPPLPPGSAWEIMTGAPVPSGADAVMMIEHVEISAGSVRLLPPRTLEPGENIVAQGAQAHAGDELLPAGAFLSAGQIALAASCGQSALDVFPRPRVAILSTGDELVPVDRQPAPGQIRNSSSPMLAAMVAAAGEPWLLPTAADNEAALDAALAQAAHADLLLITGGVSAGKFDLVEPALTRAGAQFHFTGIRIQPGKPLVFAEIPRSTSTNLTPDPSSETPDRNSLISVPCSLIPDPCSPFPDPCSLIPVFGLPGNPVSSAVTFLLFAAPVLAAIAGRRDFGPRFALARLSAAPGRRPKGGLTRFLPALCTFGANPGSMPEVALVPWHGSGDLAALARSNCFLVLPDDEPQPLEAGSIVRILLP